MAEKETNINTDMKAVAEQTKKVVENNEGMKNIKDIIGESDDTIYASSSGEYFKIKPVSISRIPKLVEILTKLDKEFKKFGDSTNAITSPESEVLDLMAEMIYMGLRKDSPDLTIEHIKDKFTINDFPVAYQKVLDVNDFLSKMRKITQVM